MEEKKSNDINPTVNAITEIIKAVPVYTDAVQPAAKQIGKSLETVAKTVNIVLAPIKALVWGYDRIESFITSRLSEKLKDVPEGNIITPLPQIAGPAIEALRYSAYDEVLRELFANLIAASMDKKTAQKAHPGYVDIIKNITSDEALLLTLFSNDNGYPLLDVVSVSKNPLEGRKMLDPNFSHLGQMVKIEYEEMIPSYLNNLCRLGILEIPEDVRLAQTDLYDPLLNDPRWRIKQSEIGDETLDFTQKLVQLTVYGKHFVDSVVAPFAIGK